MKKLFLAILLLGLLIPLTVLSCKFAFGSPPPACTTGISHHWGKWETPTKGKRASDTYLHRSCTECGMQQVTTAESE